MKDEKNTPTFLAAELEEIFKVDSASSSKDVKEMDVKEKIDVIKVQSSKICNDAAKLVIILYSVPYIIQIMPNIAFHIHIFCLQNGCRYFGNRLVTKAQLAKLNDSSLSKLTCDLLTIVFDKQELRESSLTGQKANANKNKDATKKLDPDRIAAVEGKILNFLTYYFQEILQRCYTFGKFSKKFKFDISHPC